MRLASLLVPVLVLAVTACPALVGPSDSDRMTELRQAPVSIPLSGTALVLETYVYRDFAPISEPGGMPMIAGLRIRTTDGSVVPATVSVDAMWVIMGSAEWAAVPVVEHSRESTAPNYELVARGGPKWPTGATVDVIVRLRSANGDTRLLRAPDQLIHRTD